MHQHHLRLLRDVIVAVSHRDRRQLVRHDDRLNIVGILLGSFGQRFDERTMIRSRICKQIAHDAKRPYLLQKSFGPSAYANRVVFCGHGKILFFSAARRSSPGSNSKSPPNCVKNWIFFQPIILFSLILTWTTVEFLILDPRPETRSLMTT